ncbi:M56 family metallopeptidase [Ferruginibacter sp. HRS2-29]|uniref:M56 family metallopeptidase n=1 Tax=Ferruginibacter sp. HRS2-29 TaxID=2487334 RepID=UPI0020CFB4F5|nr:M56 family metallopeptidase [Ferruginibacter sp. HRS2-29]MCP9752889.1 hypothetical protein [Ferruginibacter sp. HRS2-29]
MYLLSAQNLFTGKMIQALCWTLIHSLWQGLLLAGITGLVILFTRKKSAAVRYNLLTSALVLFMVTISITFCLQAGKAFTEVSVPLTAIGEPSITSATNTIIAVPAVTGHSSFMDLATGFFNRYATAIVFIWFLVISVRLAQMMAGLYSIQQIKKRKVSSVGSFWSLRVQQLSAQLGIKQKVGFLQSGIVKVPMVAGFLKPVIFFPLGALASLSPADVEAILLHELAHIRRKDYLINMLQHVVEILFFFNPAVLWVSALIKTERENCCDDIALSFTSNKRDYINALVSFQEFDEAQPRYATALTGKKDHLLQRVKRIVHNNNKSLNNMEKIFLIGCFLLTGTLTLVFSQTKKNNPSTETSTTKTQKTETTMTSATLDEPLLSADQLAQDLTEGKTIVYNDRSAKSRRHFVSKRNGNVYEIYGDITWFKINGKKIPQDNWDTYKTIMNDMMANYEELETSADMWFQQDSTRARKLKAEAAVIALQQKKPAAGQVKLANQDSLQSLKAQLNKLDEQKEPDMQIQALDEKKAELDQQQQKLDERKERRKDTRENRTEEHKLKAEKDKREADKNKVTTVTDEQRKVNIETVVDNDKYYTVTGLSYSVNNNINTNVNTNINTNVEKDVDVTVLTNNIIADLKKNNIISNEKNLSYQLTGSQLIVNDKVQSAALHAALKAKYIRNSDWKLLYNWKLKANR